jgi:hypothetical protein
MSKPRDDRQNDLFRPALDQIINLGHPLVRLAGEIDWEFLAGRFGSVCQQGPGQPPLPTRLVAGLFILKHMHNLSDERLCDRWLENPYFQFFCGEVVFRHELPFERSSLTRWRQRLGEEQPCGRHRGDRSVRGSDPDIRVPVCVSRRGPWSTTAPLVCSDPAPDGRVVGATDRGGIPVEHGADLFGARQ